MSRDGLMSSTALPLLLIVFPQWWDECFKEKPAPKDDRDWGEFPGWGPSPYDLPGPG